MPNERIVEENLEKMVEIERGGMHYLLLNESIGGNAGVWNKFPCAGANFLYDEEGKIEYFGNFPEAIDYLKKGLKEGNYKEGILRVAVDLNDTGKFRIIKIFTQPETEESSQKNLIETIRKYNMRYGFQVKSEE